MRINEISEFLTKRLKQPLSGAESHAKMHARMLNGDFISFTHETPPKKSGVLILLFEKNGEVFFPLTQRPIYDGVHSGQISLPGGKYEESDNDLIDTAKRETFEEIGIPKEKIEIIGTLTEMLVVASNYVVQPVVGKINQIPEFVLDPVEVGELITPSLKDLMSSSNKKETELSVRNGHKIIAPYFSLENKVVWGATAMILSELVDTLSEFK